MTELQDVIGCCGVCDSADGWRRIDDVLNFRSTECTISNLMRQCLHSRSSFRRHSIVSGRCCGRTVLLENKLRAEMNISNPENRLSFWAKWPSHMNHETGSLIRCHEKQMWLAILFLERGFIRPMQQGNCGHNNAWPVFREFSNGINILSMAVDRNELLELSDGGLTLSRIKIFKSHESGAMQAPSLVSEYSCQKSHIHAGHLTVPLKLAMMYFQHIFFNFFLNPAVVCTLNSHTFQPMNS